MERESKITKSVREAVVKAAEKGENISRKVRDALDEGLKKSEPQREKIGKVAGDALKGFSAAVQDVKTRLKEFKKKAGEEAEKAKGDADAGKHAAQQSLLKIIEAGERAGEVTLDAAMGIYLGVKEVLDRKKPVKKKAVKKAAVKKTVKKKASTKKKASKKAASKNRT